MRKFKQLLAAGFCLMIMLSVMGCGGQAVKTEYYSLNPLLAQPKLNVAPVGNFSKSTLALGPITMPEYLTSRAQIVAHADANKLNIMENARWAEPLDTNITTVLTDNLSYLLNCGEIIQYPWRVSATYDYGVELYLFTITASEDNAVMRGRYRVSATAGNKIYDGEFAYTENLAAFTPGDIVGAYNLMLDQLSLELAGQLVKLRN